MSRVSQAIPGISGQRYLNWLSLPVGDWVLPGGVLEGSLPSLIEAITNADDRAGLREAVTQFMHLFGFVGFAIGELPAPGEPAEFYLADFPDAWEDFDRAWSQAFDGEAVRGAMLGRCSFTPREVKPRPEEMLETLAMVPGRPPEALVVPVHEPGWGIGLVSFVADKIALSPTERTSAHLLSIHALERSRALSRRPAKPRNVFAPPSLTAREQQCLELVAEGLSDTEIAARLNLSWSTVHFHVEHTRRKLGARNRAHAVARAIRRRLM